MRNGRRRANARAPIREHPAKIADKQEERLDLVKVARLRALVDEGQFGVDFDVLVDRLAHAMHR
ncbi:MAG: hypothetical protein EXR75_01580 [Myxococcales bacterium]|nr:hypothetical protein [Myxococcales bacterium]